jgi:ABC-type nitrate/sulfonate/bicarbonate transport system substrate-binding protein
MKNVIAQGALALGAALLTALTPAPVQAQSLTEVTFGVLSPTAAEWPVYLANTQGFFKEEGLTVTIVQGNTPTNVLSEVATGAVNLADNGTDTEIAAIAHGLPLKLIAPMFGVNPYSVVTLPTIKTWSDLNGKSVMTGTKQDVTAMVLDSLAKAHGLKGGLGDFSIVIGGNSTLRRARERQRSGRVALAAIRPARRIERHDDSRYGERGDERLGIYVDHCERRLGVEESADRREVLARAPQRSALRLYAQS